MGGVATATLRNHPGYWLTVDAELWLARWEADHGTISVTSAGRTLAEQQQLIDRWDQGGTYNRPPYLYEPKRPAWAGTHVGGVAFDTSEWQRFLGTCAAYGWYQRYSWDVVHFEYDRARDTNHGKDPNGAEMNAEEWRQFQVLAANVNKLVERVDNINAWISEGGPGVEQALAKPGTVAARVINIDRQVTGADNFGKQVGPTVAERLIDVQKTVKPGQEK